MRVPIRKGDNRVFAAKDYYLTPTKYRELEAEIKRLTAKRPTLAAEVKRLAEMGDFSENAGYQLAKGRLRGLNQRILDLTDRLRKAEIITGDEDISVIQIGHTVSLKGVSGQKTYTILGGSESNPSQGVISHLSPLGSALLGKRVGDLVTVNGKEYQILEISN
jgi:transcription elongation factor GreA